MVLRIHGRDARDDLRCPHAPASVRTSHLATEWIDTSGCEGSMLPVIRCRECDSKLLQLERIWLLADGRHIADRRCPECSTRDSVIVGPFATQFWLARE